MNPTTCLDAALDYAARGWSPLPLCPPDHVGCGKHHGKNCTKPGKVPIIPPRMSPYWEDYQTRIATADEIKSWYKYAPNLNVGMALGGVTGLVALDIDSEEGEAYLREFSGGDLPPTLQYQTGRGRRIIYRLPAGMVMRSRPFNDDKGREALRLMGLGSQIVMPPSRHELGTLYEWEAGKGPNEIEPADAPAWMLAKAAESPAQKLAATVTDAEVIEEGGRNNFLTRLGGAMRRVGADQETIEAALVSLNERRLEPPLGEGEVKRIAASVSRYAPTAGPMVTFGAGGSASEGEPEIPPGYWNPQGPDDVASIYDLINAGAKTEWVWKGWIQRGVLTAFAAEGGTGKTRATMDVVRRVRHRLPWPDGQEAYDWPGETVALWVVGDNHHSEMTTLCEAFGTTDCVRINSHPCDPFGGVSLEHAEELAALEKRIAACKPLFVVIDTVGNTTDKNLSKQEDAKAYYAPLQVIARRQNVVILCLTHLNGAGKVLGRRVMEKVRQVWRMSAETVNDHTCRRRLEVTKSNNQYPDPLGVTMGNGGNEYDNDPPPPPEDRENAPTGPSKSVQECMEWLEDRLAASPERVAVIRKEADAKGWSAKVLYKAKDTLKVVESETGKNNAKWWGLPGSQPAAEPVVVLGGMEC